MQVGKNRYGSHIFTSTAHDLAFSSGHSDRPDRGIVTMVDIVASNFCWSLVDRTLAGDRHYRTVAHI